VKSWSFFRPETGEILDQGYSGPADALAINTPEGCQPIEGKYDCRSQRIENGVAVDWQPPQPSDDHEWRHRRWVLKPEVVERRLARERAQQQINDWEGKQERAVRELLLNPDDAFARSRLQQINDQIALLRTEL